MESDSLRFPLPDRGFLDEMPSDLDFPDSLIDSLNFEGDDLDFNIDDLLLPPEDELGLPENGVPSSWLYFGDCDPSSESSPVVSVSDLRDSSRSGVSVVGNPPQSSDRDGSTVSVGLKRGNASPLPESGCSSEGSFTTGFGDALSGGVVKPENSPTASRELSGIGSEQGVDDSEGSVSRLESEPDKSHFKRKKEQGEDVNSNLRSKFRRPDCSQEEESPSVFQQVDEEEEKRRTRLMRNRESAQLSRQRKKHYVEELEDKLRSMSSTVQELNSRIACITAENASLRQQLGSQNPQPNVFPPPPLNFPWIACPPYALVPQNGLVFPPGSQVPLVPIPRLKTQQTVSAPKSKKSSSKEDSSKGTKKPSKVTKKVASVTFICFLMFLLYSSSMFSVFNFMYGDKDNKVHGRLGFVDSVFENRTRGRVLTGVNGINGTKDLVGVNYLREMYFERCMKRGREGRLDPPRLCKECSSLPFSGSDGHVFQGNTSESMVASLYVPRNDKLVRIDGQLIIRSVLATERSMESLKSRATGDVGKGSAPIGVKAGKNGLAIKSDMQPALPSGRDKDAVTNFKTSPAEHQRALASGSGDGFWDNQKAASSFDGPLQQWFREGIAGRVLSSGTCMEVFRFEVSASTTKNPTTIFSASSRETNSSSSHHHSDSGMVKNKRFLYPTAIPLPGKTLHNSTSDRSKSTNEENTFAGSNSVSSSMVVSVLPDPRDTGDNGSTISSSKSLSRILVVVLVDSVKYVTYSCMLPFQNSSPHL